MSRITVVIRVKPEDPDKVLKSIQFKEGKTINICVSAATGGHEFHFDHIFGMESTQANIFGAHSCLIDEVMDGFNGSIIAYGQTGAGKVTYVQNQLRK